MSVHTTASIHICGDFNIHHKEWFIHSNKTTAEERHCYDFGLAYDLTQFFDKPTHIPDQSGHFSNLLDLCLTSCSDACLISVHSPLESSDPCLIQVEVQAKCIVTPDCPFHRKVFRYCNHV